ncbi:MAG: FAD-dependent oxidoreductase [Arthrobacter sp.]
MNGRVVVVGGSLSGLRFVENLQLKGFKGQIVVCSDETLMPYNRPPLSKDFLTAGTEPASVHFKTRPTLNSADWRLGVSALSTDLARSTVALSDGSVLDFDFLVAASGVRPRPLTWKRNGKRVSRMRTLADAKRLRNAITPGSRVVVIGGGFIGGEVSASARSLGAEVTLLCPGPHLLRPAIGSVLAQKIMDRHVEAGVDVRVNERLPEVNADAARIELASGETIEADIVVEAVGSLPNHEWLDAGRLDLSDGLLCDNSLLAAGSDNVYAIGDIARFPNPMFDEVPRRIEHWNIAVETARRAAQSILHVSGTQPGDALPEFRPMPAFWSNQYEYRIQAYGLPRIADRIDPLEGEMRGAPIMGYYRNDQLVAVAALDNGPELIEYSRDVGKLAVR